MEAVQRCRSCIGCREWLAAGAAKAGLEPIFYPVLNQEYATELARGFQVLAFGVSHVTRFDVDTSYLAQFDVQRSGQQHQPPSDCSASSMNGSAWPRPRKWWPPLMPCLNPSRHETPTASLRRPSATCGRSGCTRTAWLHLHVMASGEARTVTTSAVDQTEARSSVAPDSAETTKGVSAFLGRVLDQLSITSWMPSVFIVGNAAVLLAMSGKKAPSVGGAIDTLMGMEWGAVVVLLFSLVIAAVAIQAYEFESLRFFEGYNRSRGMKGFVERRIRSHKRHRRKLESSAWELQLRALASARRNAESQGIITPRSSIDWDLAERLVRRRPLNDLERFLVQHGGRASDPWSLGV